MPTARRATAPPPPPPPHSPPASSDVVLDVEVERGALHFVIATIGRAPVHAMRVRLSRTLRDLAGQKLNDHTLFTQLEFLGPGRRVRLFVDTLAGYVARRQPMRFDARLEWRDDAGQVHRRTITHDLAAWTGLRETL